MSGTRVNLTVHESSEAGDKVMDVRLRLEDAVINIRYIKNKPFRRSLTSSTTRSTVYFAS